MNDVKNILLITTGGTIEKSYDEWEGSIANRESLMRKKLISKLRTPFTQITIQNLINKDSLDMVDEDRELIFKTISKNLGIFDGILISHGTDTLEVTAKYCAEKIDDFSIPVVLTGAMKPAGFDDSDALQNFTEALFTVRNSPAGFYLAFHGKLYTAPYFTKNKEKLLFEETR